MPIKVILRDINEAEEALRFYVSDTPMSVNALPAPAAVTGPSDTLTDESAEHGADAVSHTVPWNELQSAYVRVGAVRAGAESVSQEWVYTGTLLPPDDVSGTYLAPTLQRPEDVAGIHLPQ